MQWKWRCWLLCELIGSDVVFSVSCSYIFLSLSSCCVRGALPLLASLQHLFHFSFFAPIRLCSVGTLTLVNLNFRTLALWEATLNKSNEVVIVCIGF